VGTDGSTIITGKGCSYVSFWNSDKDDNERCELDAIDGNSYYNAGTCYCKSDNCNDPQPSILENDDDRLKCYHCPYASNALACAKQDRDYNLFGPEITCPKGVRYCKIKETTQSGEPRFYRGCDTKIYDDLDDDDIYMGLGACGGSRCTCGQNKCNTGFHGVKCHSYEVSDCDKTDISTGGGTVQCLTGIGTCGVVKKNFHDFCQSLTYNCGFGRNSSGCDSGKNVAGIVDEAEVCYCDATGGDDLCDPTNSSSSLVSNLAIIMTVVVFAFKQLYVSSF